MHATENSFDFIYFVFVLDSVFEVCAQLKICEDWRIRITIHLSTPVWLLFYHRPYIRNRDFKFKYDDIVPLLWLAILCLGQGCCVFSVCDVASECNPFWKRQGRGSPHPSQCQESGRSVITRAWPDLVCQFYRVTFNSFGSSFKYKCSDSPTLVISHQNVILPLHNRGLQILLASGEFE